MASYFSGKSVVEGKQLIYFKKQNPTLGDASDGDGDDSDSDDAFFSGKTIAVSYTHLTLPTNLRV